MKPEDMVGILKLALRMRQAADALIERPVEKTISDAAADLRQGSNTIIDLCDEIQLEKPYHGPGD